MDVGAIAQIATPEKTYTDNSDDKFIMQIHFAMAKKSSDDTSQFVRRDVESKLLRGEYPGRVPLGYLNITRAGHIAGAQADPEKESLLHRLGRPLRREEIDPIVGPLVRRLFEEAATGAYTLRPLRRPALSRWACGPEGRQDAQQERASADPAGQPLLPRGHRATAAALRRTPAAGADRQPRRPGSSTSRSSPASSSSGSRSGLRPQEGAGTAGTASPTAAACCAAGSADGPVTAERQKGHVYYHCTEPGGVRSQRRWTREEKIDAEFSRAPRPAAAARPASSTTPCGVCARCTPRRPRWPTPPAAGSRASSTPPSGSSTPCCS